MVAYMDNSLSKTSGAQGQRHLRLKPMPNPKATVLLPHLYPHRAKELESVK